MAIEVATVALLVPFDDAVVAVLCGGAQACVEQTAAVATESSGTEVQGLTSGPVKVRSVTLFAFTDIDDTVAAEVAAGLINGAAAGAAESAREVAPRLTGLSAEVAAIALLGAFPGAVEADLGDAAGSVEGARRRAGQRTADEALRDAGIGSEVGTVALLTGLLGAVVAHRSGDPGVDSDHSANVRSDWAESLLHAGQVESAKTGSGHEVGSQPY